MPTIQKIFVLEISPEQFIKNCTETELRETLLLVERELRHLEQANRQAQVETQDNSEKITSNVLLQKSTST
jgi:hypothetical protein